MMPGIASQVLPRGRLSNDFEDLLQSFDVPLVSSLCFRKAALPSGDVRACHLWQCFRDLRLRVENILIGIEEQVFQSLFGHRALHGVGCRMQVSCG